jgi:hypothetical protein
MSAGKDPSLFLSAALPILGAKKRASWPDMKQPSWPSLGRGAEQEGPPARSHAIQAPLSRGGTVRARRTKLGKSSPGP